MTNITSIPPPLKKLKIEQKIKLSNAVVVTKITKPIIRNHLKSKSKIRHNGIFTTLCLDFHGEAVLKVVLNQNCSSKICSSTWDKDIYEIWARFALCCYSF